MSKNTNQNPAQRPDVRQPQQKKRRYEIFNSNNGKPSACKWIGSISAIVTLALIVASIIFYMVHVAEGAIILQILDKLISVFGISVGLLGVKSIASSVGGNKVTIQNTTNSDGSITRTKTMSKRYGGAGGSYEDDKEVIEEIADPTLIEDAEQAEERE